MHMLRAADHRRMPWKNGGGVTTEIAVFPEGAGLDAFEWRLSMATVSGDGPFSRFPGIDRTLAVLEGEGIVLSVEGMPDAMLTGAAEPFAFPADKPSSARLIGGAIMDFNVMTRRGAWVHRVERLLPGRPVSFDGDITMVFCATGPATMTSDGTRVELGMHDAAIIEAAGCEIAGGDGAVLYVVTLSRIA